MMTAKIILFRVVILCRMLLGIWSLILKSSKNTLATTHPRVRLSSGGVEWRLSRDPILSYNCAIGSALANFDSPLTYGRNL
jgi:hypothetical protein